MCDHDSTAFIGLVLAGGASSRMGQDKACLVLDGETLLDRAIRTLRQAGVDQVLVSGWRPDHAGIPDRYPGLGPVGGISSVIEARPDLRGHTLVIIPVDMPGLRSSTLAQLIKDTRKHPCGVQLKGWPLPLTIRVTEELAAWLHNQSAQADRLSLRALAASAGVTPMEMAPNPEKGMLAPCSAASAMELANINTPQAWSFFRANPGTD